MVVLIITAFQDTYPPSTTFCADRVRKSRLESAGPRSAVGSGSDSRARDPGFNTRSVHILPFRNYDAVETAGSF